MVAVVARNRRGVIIFGIATGKVHGLYERVPFRSHLGQKWLYGMAPLPFLSFIFTDLRWPGHASPTRGRLLIETLTSATWADWRSRYIFPTRSRTRRNVEAFRSFLSIHRFIYDGIESWAQNEPTKLSNIPMKRIVSVV